MIEAVIVQKDEDLLKRIRQSAQFDNHLKEAITVLKKKGPTQINSDISEWDIQDDLIIYRGHVYVPLDEELR